MQISESIRALADRAEAEMNELFTDIDRISRANTEHILDCFREVQVSESLFAPSTGITPLFETTITRAACSVSANRNSPLNPMMSR